MGIVVNNKPTNSRYMYVTIQMETYLISCSDHDVMHAQVTLWTGNMDTECPSLQGLVLKFTFLV